MTILWHWGACFLIAIYLTAYRFSKDTPKIFAITWAYLLTLSVVTICLKQLGYWGMAGIKQTFLLATTGFAAWVITVFGVCAYASTEYKLERIFRLSLPLFAILAAFFFVLAGVKFVPHASTNATTMVLALPIVFSSHRLTLWVKGLITALVVYAIIKADCSSPLGVIAVVIASYAYFKTSGLHRVKLGLIALLPIIVACLYYSPQRIFDDTARFEAYRIFMSWWWADPWQIQVFGYGPGTFEILCQFIQKETGFMLGQNNEGVFRGWLWMHLHSDWLQFIWEYGLVGFSLVVAGALSLLKSLDRPEYKSVLLGISSSMVFDFPLRYPVSPLILIFLFSIAFNQKEE